MTIRAGSHAAEIVAEAREIAARGAMPYHAALDIVARDQGYVSWQGALALCRDSQTEHPGGSTAAMHDMTSVLALMMSANSIDRKRDRYPRVALRFVWALLTRLPGISPAVLARLAHACAMGTCALWLTLTAVLVAIPHPLGSYADRMILMMPVLLVMDAWIASRWLLANRDPLRPVCRAMRVGVCTLVAFRTLLSAVPWNALSGIDLRPMQIAHFVAMTTGGILWLVAMHADVLAAEVRHDQ